MVRRSASRRGDRHHGFSSAQRFELGAAAGVASPHRYLALYETAGESPAEVLERLDRSRPRRQQSDAIDRAGAGVWVFRPLGDQHRSIDATAREPGRD